MDIIKELEKDHKEVEKIFKELNKTTEEDTEARKAIFGKLKSTILLHSKIEDDVLYDRINNKEIKGHSKEEHKKIEDKINEVEQISMFSENWKNKLQELHEIVKHHINEEETETFKEVKREFNSEQLNQFGEEFVSKKEEVAS